MHGMISGIVQERYGEFNPAAALIRIDEQVSHTALRMKSGTIAGWAVVPARSHL